VVIPTAALPARVTITPRVASGSLGPRLGAPTGPFPARIRQATSRVTTATGDTVTANATVTLRPDVALPPMGSVVTDERTGRTYDVLGAEVVEALSRPHHLMLAVVGPKAAA